MRWERPASTSSSTDPCNARAAYPQPWCVEPRPPAAACTVTCATTTRTSARHMSCGGATRRKSGPAPPTREVMGASQLFSSSPAERRVTGTSRRVAVVLLAAAAFTSSAAAPIPRPVPQTVRPARQAPQSPSPDRWPTCARRRRGRANWSPGTAKTQWPTRRSSRTSPRPTPASSSTPSRCGPTT